MRGVREVFLCGESSSSLRSSKAKKRSKRCRGEAGASLVEYALCAALIALASLTAMTDVQEAVAIRLCMATFAVKNTDQLDSAEVWAMNGWNYGQATGAPEGSVTCNRKSSQFGMSWWIPI